MIINIFAVYDTKARCFATPFFATTPGVALRSFVQATNEHGTTINSHPEDFTLFHLGRWNDDNGIFEPFEHFVNLGIASQFKTREIDHGTHAQQPLSDATQLQPGPEGGNSKKHVRP